MIETANIHLLSVKLAFDPDNKRDLPDKSQSGASELSTDNSRGSFFIGMDLQH